MKIKNSQFFYANDKILGEGAFGKVYFGVDQNKSMPVAIKILCNSKKLEQR